PQVSQFTSAWIIAEDPDNPGDTVAMSTSWYSPVGSAANDWLISPRITLSGNTEVRWQGEADDPQFPDGYQLWVCDATSPFPISNFDSLVFDLQQESGGVRTNHSVNLSQYGFANQDVYLGWRNNSFDQFILILDNIEVRNPPIWDVEMVDAERFEYTMLSKKQQKTIPLNGEIQNKGLLTATGVSMTVNVYDGNFTQVYTATSPTQILGPGSSSFFSVTPFMPTDSGLYTFEYVANMSAQDQDTTNNLRFWGLLMNDTTMARDDGDIHGQFGIGGGSNGIVGQMFELCTPDLLSSVSFYMLPTVGQEYYAEIYSFNGQPQSVIARTDTFVATSDSGQWVTLPLVNAPLLLPADSFYIGVREPDSTLELGYTNFVWREAVTWLDWPG
ncbi:MAG: choice-of-anchor J domain-containing protein, partial [Bacteroidota bacterium]